MSCARNDELPRRMGQAGKPDSTPMLWVTALVLLTTGIPWSWRLGKGNASERAHLGHLIATLPGRALVIADAGFHGYDLAAALLAAHGSFLIRMSSKVQLFVDSPVDPRRFDQGAVTYWPHEARRRRQPPLRLRLIRVRGRRRAKEARRQVDIWLLTDVGAERLSVAQAAAFYRLRWENEGLFRTYKRTLGEVHLVGHTVRAVHREAYGSLLSCQLPLAQGAWELRQRRGPRATAVEPYGARQAIVVIRQELIAAMKPDRRVSYRERLGSCARERRERTSRKEKRESPRRMPHVPPKPPRLLTMNEKEKALFSRLDAAS